MDLEIRAFGPLEIWRGAVPSPMASRRQQLLLALLLVRRGGVVPVPVLAEVLWPRQPPATVGKSIQIHVHRLRRALGVTGVLLHRPPGYAVILPPASVDIYRFEELVQRGRAALVSGDAATAADLFGQAATIYRGPAFHGLDDVDGLAIESQRLDQLRLAGLEDRITAELALGGHAGLVAELATLVAEHPLRERFRAQLMTALYRSGRKAEALAAYRDGRRILADELGVEPDEECQALAQAIRTDDPALLRPAAPPVARPAGAGEAGAGEAGGAEAGAAEAGQPRVAVPRQLPADVAGFTGRGRQLRWLAARLRPAEPGSALVLVVEGTAGVGKTALAVHWAHRVRDRFPDGQLYVNLRGYAAGPPLASLQALAGFLRAFGVPAERIPTELDEAAAAYRSELAGRRVLVLLDNAGGAAQVRPLLPGGGPSAVLLTSRDRLTGLVAWDGAVRLALDVLPAGEARELLGRTVGARRVAAEPEAARELVELCGRLPLALRIAAANLTDRRQARFADYLAQLRGSDRLAALAVSGDEQSAVRAAFDLSYQRLPEPARVVFRRLGLVPGPDVTAEAVAALAGTTAEAAQPALAALAGAHLVEEHRPGRYACHDLLRAYARERVRAEEPEDGRQAALTRLYAHYLGAADAAARLLYPHTLRLPRTGGTEPAPVGFPDPGAAVRWLDAELPNLITAAQHAAADGTGDRAYAWLLADALRSYLLRRGQPADATVLADAGLVAAAAAGERRAYGCALLGRAGLHHRRGHGPEAIDDLTEALAAFREIGWAEGQASLLGNLGSVHMELGRLHEALDYHTEALALHKRTGSRYGQAGMVGNISMQLILLGRLQEAADHAHRALTVLAGLGSDQREATNLGNLGEIYRLAGEFGVAQRSYAQAQARYRTVGDRDGEARTLLGFAVIHNDTGRPEPARKLALAALRLFRDAGHRRFEAAALIGLGQIYRRSGQPAPAAEASQRARDLAGEIGDRYLQSEALIELAALGPPAGDGDLARASAESALDLTRTAGFRLLEGQALTASAALHLAAGDLDRAVGAGEHALAVHQETGHRPGEARTQALLGRARHRAGDTAGARDCQDRARRLFTEMGIRPAAAARPPDG